MYFIEKIDQSPTSMYGVYTPNRKLLSVQNYFDASRLLAELNLIYRDYINPLKAYSKQINSADYLSLPALIYAHDILSREYARINADMQNQWNDTRSSAMQYQEVAFKDEFISYAKLRDMTLQQISDILT